MGLVGFFWVLGETIKSFSEKTILKVNRDKIYIKWVLGRDFVWGERTILTNKISRMGLSKTGKVGQAATIWQGVKPIKFGASISQVEQEWLLEEIQYFLKQNSH